MSLKYPLSGELSRRPIGGQAGVLRRLSRQAGRDGHEGVAAGLALRSADAKLNEQGFGSAEEDRTMQRRGIDVQRGLLETQRRSLLRPDTAPATGELLGQRKALYAEMQQSGATPAMQQRATELGVTQSGFDRASGNLSRRKPYASLDEMVNSNGGAEKVQLSTAASAATAPTASVAAPQTAPVNGTAGSIVSDLTGIVSYARDTAEKSRREGLRSSYDKLTGSAAEPGNLSELTAAAPRARQVDMPGIAGPPRSAATGPLTQAMNEAMARRADQTAADDALAQRDALRSRRGNQLVGGAIVPQYDTSPDEVESLRATAAAQQSGREALYGKPDAPLPPAGRDGTLKDMATRPVAPAVPPSVSSPPARFPENNTTSVEDRLKRYRAAQAKDPGNRPTPARVQGTVLGSLLEFLSR